MFADETLYMNQTVHFQTLFAIGFFTSYAVRFIYVMTHMPTSLLLLENTMPWMRSFCSSKSTICFGFLPNISTLWFKSRTAPGENPSSLHSHLMAVCNSVLWDLLSIAYTQMHPLNCTYSDTCTQIKVIEALPRTLLHRIALSACLFCLWAISMFKMEWCVN